MPEADIEIGTDGPALRQVLADMEAPLRRLRGLTEATLLAAQGAGKASAAFVALAEAMEAEGNALADAWRANRAASRSA